MVGELVDRLFDALVVRAVVVAAAVVVVVELVAVLGLFLLNLPLRCSLNCRSKRVRRLGVVWRGVILVSGGVCFLVVVVVVVALVIGREKSGGHDRVRGRASAGFVFFQLW